MVNREIHGPIFIGGPDRCGKTTLQAFLSSHPNIAIPAVGSNLWSYFYGQFGNLKDPKNFERCLDAILHYTHALYLEPDSARLRQEFWQGAPTYARLFALLHEHYAERLGKPRWGDQTGLLERYADPIFAAFPEARIIHMIRDPRDRYEASLAMWPKGKGRVGVAAARWRYSAALAIRNMARYPDRYRIVRFETLVRQPEETLREICAFLDEDYFPEMLSMDGSPGHRGKLLQGFQPPAGAPPLSGEFIGRYRQVLSRSEIAFLQKTTGKQMLVFGYRPDPVRFSVSERARFEIVERPANLARMAAWLAMEKIQHTFPGVAGRKPSSAMIVHADRAPEETKATAPQLDHKG